MTTAEIVPFGKYKGQPVEVLAGDEDYCQWLSDQPWFQQKFPGLRTLIINNFKVAEDTPEHNKIQILFLDDEFCYAFIRKVSTKWKGVSKNRTIGSQDIEEVEKIYKEDLGKSIKAQIENLQEKVIELNEEEESYSRNDRIKFLLLVIRKIEEKVGCSFFQKIKREFEKEGVDVVLQIGAELKTTYPHYETDAEGALYYSEEIWNGWIPDRFFPKNEYNFFCIEIKPQLGDDYPSVLRQMKNSQSNYLLVDRFQASISREALVSFFKNESIKVVFLSDIEEELQNVSD